MAENKIKRTFKTKYNLSDDKGCFIGDIRRNVAILWVTDDKEIYHEAFHAVYWILNRIGISLNDSTEEAWCYLLDYIIVQMKG